MKNTIEEILKEFDTAFFGRGKGPVWDEVNNVWEGFVDHEDGDEAVDALYDKLTDFLKSSLLKVGDGMAIKDAPNAYKTYSIAAKESQQKLKELREALK